MPRPTPQPAAVRRPHEFLGNDESELVHAAGDAYRAGLLDMDPAELHPLARKMLRDGGPLTLNALAAEVCAIRLGHIPDTPRAAITAALRTVDFGDIVLETARGIAVARAAGSELFEAIRRVTSDVEVETFAAESYSIVDLDELPMPSRTTEADFWPIRPRIAGEPVRVHTLPAKLVLTEQVLANDDRGFIRAAVSAFTDNAHRAELRHLATLLASNPTMSDGEPLFVDEVNAHDGTPEDPIALLERMLRDQPTESQQPAAARLATLLLPSALEGTYRKRVYETRAPEHRPALFVCPYLDNTEVYAFADPRYFPAIARARLRGSALSGVSFPTIGPAAWADRQTGRTHHVPGLALDATHSVGLLPVSRVGVVRLRLQA